MGALFFQIETLTSRIVDPDGNPAEKPVEMPYRHRLHRHAMRLPAPSAESS